MSLIKTAKQIDKMRVAGKLAAEVLQMIEPYILPGISTEEIDNLCYNFIVDKQKAKPASLNYLGFPKSICTSINEVVCHGIPDKTILKDGDIVNLDVAVIKDGWFGDTSKMFAVGEISPEANKLMAVTRECMCLGIKKIRPGLMLSEVGRIIQAHAESSGFSVVRDLTGHGIGSRYHEEPYVFHYHQTQQDWKLEPGMIFTVEPMINAGTPHVYLDEDGWTIRTVDRSLSAQYEHTVLVTSSGYEVLTLRDGENI